MKAATGSLTGVAGRVEPLRSTAAETDHEERSLRHADVDVAGNRDAEAEDRPQPSRAQRPIPPTRTENRKVDVRAAELIVAVQESSNPLSEQRRSMTTDGTSPKPQHTSEQVSWRPHPTRTRRPLRNPTFRGRGDAGSPARRSGSNEGALHVRCQWSAACPLVGVPQRQLPPVRTDTVVHFGPRLQRPG